MEVEPSSSSSFQVPPLDTFDADDPFANITPLDVGDRSSRQVFISGASPLNQQSTKPTGRYGRKRMSVIDAISLEHRRNSGELSDDEKANNHSNSQMVASTERAHIDQSSISKAEYANIVKMFQIHDADGSGTIDSKELRTVMLSLGHQLSDSQLGDLMYEITGQKDCTLDFEDFVKLILFWKDAARFRLFERETAPGQEHIELASDTQGKFLPDHPVRRLWDLVMLATIIFVFGTTTFFYCIFNDDDARQRYTNNLAEIEAITAVLMLMDTIMGCFTVQIEGRHIVCDTPSVLKMYLQRWGLVDALTILPYWLFIPPQAAVYVNSIRLLRLLKINSLFQSSGRIPMDPSFVDFYYRNLPLIEGLSFFVSLVHCIAVIEIYQQPDGANTVSYGSGIYYALLLISGVGSDVVPSTNDTVGKQWYSVAVMITGQLINAVAVGSLVRYFQISDIAGVRAEKLAETAAVCQFFSIPEALGNEILQFQDHILQHNLSVAYFDLIKGLPNEMKVHIGIYARIRLIRNHPIFSMGHEAVRVAVAQALEAAVYTPEEYVVIADDVDDDMFIVAHGFLDVLSKHAGYVGTLKMGDHFAEVSLFHETPHAFSIKTLTYCELYALGGLAFDSLMERFNTFRKDVNVLLEKMHEEAAAVTPSASLTLNTSLLSGDGGLHDLSFLPKETFESFSEHKRHLAAEAARRFSRGKDVLPSEMEEKLARVEKAAATGGLLSPTNPITPRRKNWKPPGVPPTPRPVVPVDVPETQEEPPNITDLAVRKSKALHTASSIVAPEPEAHVFMPMPDDEFDAPVSFSKAKSGAVSFSIAPETDLKRLKSRRFEDRKRVAKENDMVALAQLELQRQATSDGLTSTTSPNASFHATNASFQVRGTVSPGPSPALHGAPRQRSAFGSSVSSDMWEHEEPATSIVPPALERIVFESLLRELTGHIADLDKTVTNVVERLNADSKS